jgi:hypothetical protein
MSNEHLLYLYECKRVGHLVGPITGNVEKPVWKSLPATMEFVLATTGKPASQRTWAKACWDDRNLYFAFWCEDMDIWNDMRNRNDRVWLHEAIEIFLVPGQDATWYYEFQFSPRNVVRDVLVHNPTRERADYVFDGDWECVGMETAVQMEGTLDDRSDQDAWWSMEIRIPFAALDLRSGQPPAEGEEWLINFNRVERAPVEEFISWSPTYRDPADFHYPPRFGRLQFAG